MTVYSCKSEATARTNASRLLTNANIQAYITELQAEQSKRTQITADDVVKELKTIAFADVETTGKEKIKALELLGKHLGMFNEKGDLLSPENKKLTNLFDMLSEGLKK